MAPSSLSHLHRRFSQAGFGLLEVILVFVIILGASAATFAVYQSARTSAAISKEIDLLTLEGQAIHEVYAQQHNFTGLNDSTAANSKVIVPTQYVVHGAPVNTYGRPSTIKAYGVATSPIKACRNGVDSCYTIQTSVDSADCVRFVMALHPIYPLIAVNLNGVMSSDEKTIKQPLLLTQCAAADPVIVSIYGK